jgi:hypothetical protein
MRILWTLIKIVVGLAIAIPLGILALALTVGIVGTLAGLAILAIKLAVVGFVAYGAIRVARAMFGSRKAPATPVQPIRELPSVDPYYQAAMRELDTELGHPTRG